MKTFLEARKMYDGGRAAKTGWDCGDCGAEKNRSDQCRSCGSPARYHRKPVSEDLASGRPAKKPVSGNLLKQRAKENEKALASGFMKLTPKERAKESKRLSEDYSDHKKNKYELYSDDKTGHPDKKAHDDIHKAVTHPSGDLKHVDAAMKKHEKHGASDTASREQIHKHFTKHHADKEGKTWHFKEAYTIKTGSKKEADKLYDKAHAAIGLKKKSDTGLVKVKGGWERKRTFTRVKESTRDNYNPVTSAKVTKEKLKKVGLPTEPPIVKEAKKPIVHFKGKDSLKTVKIKYNKPIKTKVTDIGPGGKEVVRKDWSEGIERDSKSNSFNRTKAKTSKVRIGQKRDEKTGKMVDVMGTSTAPQGFPKLKEMVTGFRKGDENVSKKGTLHKSSHITPDRDGGKVADALNKHGRLKTIKKAHKKLVDKKSMSEEQKRVVESLGKLMSRGLDKVRSSIKDAEKKHGPVDPAKRNIPNPVSGKNIAKRMAKVQASQKKR